MACGCGDADKVPKLPKAVPADSFYRQIERLEDDKANLSKQHQFQQTNQTQDVPMVFKDYTNFFERNQKSRNGGP